MDTKDLEKFCPWARIRLIDEVRQRCYAYGLDDAGREEFNRDATIVKARCSLRSSVRNVRSYIAA